MGIVTYVLSILTFLVLNTCSCSWSLENHVLSGSRVGRASLGTLGSGMRQALDECQSQFKWDRWTCPESSFNVVSKHGKLPATRESAFVVAMVSAGITHMFARNCSRGQKSCRCDERPRKREPDSSWSWGGCSADIKYAGDFSRRLLIGKVEAIRDLNAAMNRHNNNVGRAAVRKSLLRACKCHGPSGTCTTKTCWLQPGELSAVGRRLRKAYDRAHLVKVNRGVPKWPDAKRVLVYAVPADNYCLPNRSLDTTGTYGRECSRRTGSGVSRTERDSCRNLCYDCGYGVRQVAVTTRSSCNCRFLWCCSVKCDSCDVNVTKYFCH
nr:protein Wnt-8b-like [Dermacentor andersoni]